MAMDCLRNLRAIIIMVAVKDNIINKDQYYYNKDHKGIIINMEVNKIDYFDYNY